MNMRIKIGIAAIAAGTSFGAFAESVYVGTGETQKKNVAEGATQADALVLAPRSTLLKTGTGKYTVPEKLITSHDGSSIKVQEGTLSVQAGGTAPALSEPAVLGSAAIDLDASKASSFVEDGTKITDWLDSRETGNATDGYTRYRAVSNATAALITELGLSEENLYPVRTVYDGKDAVYFQGYRSGCWMRLVTAANGQANLLVKNVFAVVARTPKAEWGCVWGINKGADSSSGSYATHYAFCPGSANKSYPLWQYYNRYCWPAHVSRSYVNGVEIDAFSETKNFVPDSRCLLEVELLGASSIWQNIFNDRGYTGKKCSYPAPSNVYFQNEGSYFRVGGDYIHEMVAFTNALTSAERLQVSEYLMRKWGTQVDHATTVEVARGATYERDASAGCSSVGSEFSGAGTYAIRQDDGVATIGRKECDDFVGSVRISGGSLLSCASHTMSLLVGESLNAGVGVDGCTYSTSASVEPNSLVKSGNGTARLNEIPEGTAKIRVNGGELILEAARETKLHGLKSAEELVSAVVTNGSFELGTENQQNLSITDGGEAYGWHAIVPESGYDEVFYYNGKKTGGKNTTTWALPNNIPDGHSAFVIKRNASVWTTVKVPVAGRYRISLWGSCRQATSQSNLILDIMIGKSADALTLVEPFRIPTHDGNYHPYHFFTESLEPGEYQLWFKTRNLDLDFCTIIDDLKMTLMTEEDKLEVPNGDFENTVDDYALFDHFMARYYYHFATNNVNSTRGWTLTQPTSENIYYSKILAGTELYELTLFTTPNTIPSGKYADEYKGFYYNRREGDEGLYQLHLPYTGTASTTFTPPKGTYVLVADACLMVHTADNSRYLRLQATVTPDGGAAVSLGEVQIYNDYVLTERQLPNAFTSDGETPVTLTLKCGVGSGNKCGSLMVDNVRLMPVAIDSVVVNGGFETTTGWTYTTASNGYHKAERIAPTNTAKYDSEQYGTSSPDGTYAANICDNSSVYQDVTIPEAGVYRLTFIGRERCGWGVAKQYGPNPLAIRLIRNAGTAEAVTNNIVGEMNFPMTNFVQHTFLTYVAQAGTYRLTFDGLNLSEGHVGTYKGGGRIYDASTMIDSVSLVRENAMSDVPDMSEDVQLFVAADAKLRLDYAGTNRVERLIWGSRAIGGTVSRATRPDLTFLEGPGTLEVKQRGFFITVR